jgi:hypothetical protein
MFSASFLRLIFLTIAVLCSFSAPAWASTDTEPAIDDIIITTSSTHLLLFATVKNGFTEEMLEGVRNGIPLSFSFDIELERVRSKWFDVTLVEKTITHTLTYDAIKEEYTVTMSEKKNPQVTRSRKKARQLMAEISGLEVIELNKLIPDAPYALQMKATLVENTLPLGMHYVLPFTSLWNFETDWRTIEFRY